MSRERDYTRDHYATLGVSRDAEPAEIRRAYRLKVRQIHPDISRNKADAHAAFIQLQESYAILSDEEERRRYDNSLAARSAPITEQPKHQPPSDDNWIRQAERDLAEGNLRTAHKALAEILRRNPEHPKALLLLAKVFGAAGRKQDRLTVLHYGVEHNPSDSPLRLELNKALAEAARVRPVQKRRQRKPGGRFLPAVISIAVVLPVYLHFLTSAGPPLPVLESLIGTTPANAILATITMAAFIAYLAAWAEVVPQLDDLLLYNENRACAIFAPRPRMPVPGLVMVPMAMLNYLLAVAWFLGIWFTRGSVSAGLAGVFLLAPLLSIVVAVIYPHEMPHILLWLPGWTLFAAFAGWFLGDLIRP